MTTVDMVAMEVMVDTVWVVAMAVANRRGQRHINSIATPPLPHTAAASAATT